MNNKKKMNIQYSMIPFLCLLKKTSEKTVYSKSYSTQECQYLSTKKIKQKGLEVFNNLKGHPPLAENCIDGHNTVTFYKENNLPIDQEVLDNFDPKNSNHYVYDSNTTHTPYVSANHQSIIAGDKIITTTNRLGFFQKSDMYKTTEVTDSAVLEAIKTNRKSFTQEFHKTSTKTNTEEISSEPNEE